MIVKTQQQLWDWACLFSYIFLWVLKDISETNCMKEAKTVVLHIAVDEALHNAGENVIDELLFL